MGRGCRRDAGMVEQGGGEVSTTEKFELDARFKKSDFIRNMRLLDEALKRASNSVQQSKQVNSKKRRVK